MNTARQTTALVLSRPGATPTPKIRKQVKKKSNIPAPLANADLVTAALDMRNAMSRVYMHSLVAQIRPLTRKEKREKKEADDRALQWWSIFLNLNHAEKQKTAA